MIIVIRTAAAGILLTVALAAQSSAQFEVASIKPSAEQTAQVNLGLHISGSQVRIAYMSLKDYIGMAYRVRIGQIEGPDWIAQERFDIAAKIPDGVPPDQVPEMLQALLAERFQLRAHRESKPFSVYALVVKKDGPKLSKAAESDRSTEQPGTANVTASARPGDINLDFGSGSFFGMHGNRIEARRVTMTQIANMLTRFMDRPVENMTQLDGAYDLAFDIAPDDLAPMMIRSALNAGIVLPPQAYRALDGASGDPFSGPLGQFGLTLESRKAPLDVIVVDDMRKTPTDN